MSSRRASDSFTERCLSAPARRLNLEEPARQRRFIGTQPRRQGICFWVTEFPFLFCCVGSQSLASRGSFFSPSVYDAPTIIASRHFPLLSHGISQDGYTLSVFVGAQRSCLDDRLDAGSSGRSNRLKNNRGRKYRTVAESQCLLNDDVCKSSGWGKCSEPTRSNKQIVTHACRQLTSFAEQKGSSGDEYRVLVTLMTINCQPLVLFIHATEAKKLTFATISTPIP